MTYDYKKDIDPTLAEMKKGYEEIGNKEKDSINQKKDKNIAYAEKETAEKIDETTDDYVDILRSAGIQKELDLRDIQETRANMGLSRSGLSATEQTAAILSAGNKTAAAQRNRQKAIDSLNQSLANYRIQQETEANDAILAIDKGIEENLAKARVDLTNKANELTSADIKAEIEAETKRQESDDKVTIAQIKASKNNDDDLYKLAEKGLIEDDTLKYAIGNGLTVKQAIEHEDQELPTTYLKPTAAIYQGAVKVYTGGFGGKEKNEAALDAYLLSPELEGYDIDLIKQFAMNENNRPLIRFELVDDGGNNYLGGYDKNGVVRDVITGRTYTGVQLYNEFKRQGLNNKDAKNKVIDIQKKCKVINSK